MIGIKEDGLNIAMELLRSIFFTLDWRGLIANDAQLGELIHCGHRVNRNL